MFQQACDVYERALKIDDKALVFDRNDIICSLDKLGLVNMKLDRIDKAQIIIQSRSTRNILLEEFMCKRNHL